MHFTFGWNCWCLCKHDHASAPGLAGSRSHSLWLSRLGRARICLRTKSPGCDGAERPTLWEPCIHTIFIFTFIFLFWYWELDSGPLYWTTSSLLPPLPFLIWGRGLLSCLYWAQICHLSCLSLPECWGDRYGPPCYSLVKVEERPGSVQLLIWWKYACDSLSKAVCHSHIYGKFGFKKSGSEELGGKIEGSKVNCQLKNLL